MPHNSTISEARDAIATREDPKTALQKAFADVHFSVTRKSMRSFMRPEEVEELVAHGVDPKTFTVPVLFGYRMPISSQYHQYAQDAIKMRKGYTSADVGADLDKYINNFLHKIFGVDYVKTREARPNTATLQTIAQLKAMAKSGNVIIVTMPSSSELPMMLAHHIQSYIPGAQIAPPDFLSKTDPLISKQYAQEQNLDLSKIPNYAQRTADIEDLLMDANTHPDKTSVEYKNLTKRLRKAIDDRDKMGEFQRKKYMTSPKTGYGRAYYRWIQANPNTDIPSNVIVVDDNIVGGDTLAEVAKELTRHHRAPVNMVGIVLHQFQSASNKDVPPIRPFKEGCQFATLRTLLG